MLDQETSQPNMALGRSIGHHGNEGRPFLLALPRAKYCDNSAESLVVNASKENRTAQIAFLFLSPAVF